MQDARLRPAPWGPAAVRVEVPDAATAAALATWINDSNIAAREVVPGAQTVVLDGVDDIEATVRRLSTWQGTNTERDAHAPVEVPVRYDGPDLDDVADRWGVTASDVPDLIAGLDLVSTFCGFAPGFAYLAGLPEELWVPRLDTPRARVEPGSIAVADRWLGAYPSASPGGWRLLGHTEAVLFDVRREPPALLAPGTPVRLVPR